MIGTHQTQNQKIRLVTSDNHAFKGPEESLEAREPAERRVLHSNTLDSRAASPASRRPRTDPKERPRSVGGSLVCGVVDWKRLSTNLKKRDQSQ